MKRLIKKASVNVEEIVKKLDKDKMIKAAEEEIASDAKYYSEDYYDDDDIIDWDTYNVKDLNEAFYQHEEDMLDDFGDSKVLDYIFEVVGDEINDLTDENLKQIIQKFGYDTIKEFIIENGHTEQVDRYLDKMETRAIEYLQDNYDDYDEVQKRNYCEERDEPEYYYDRYY